MMTLTQHLNERTQFWRSQAAGLRERYKGMGDLGHPGRSAAEALELCATDVENALAAARKPAAPTPAPACEIGGPS